MDHSDKHGLKGVRLSGQGALNEARWRLPFWARCMAMAEAAQSKLMVLHTAASRVGAMDIGATNEGGMKPCLTQR